MALKLMRLLRTRPGVRHSDDLETIFALRVIDSATNE